MQYRNTLRQFNKLRSLRGMQPASLEEYLHRISVMGH
jgi:hypothetical protein